MAPRHALQALAAALVLGYPLLAGNSYLLYAGVLVMMYAALAVGWNLMGGFTGYISLGHSAFFGVGAYAAGIAITKWNMPHVPAILFAGAFTGIIALAIGYVALRVRGASFVIVTIALVYITNLLAQALGGLTGGSSGLRLPRFAGLDRTDNHLVFFYAFLGLLLVGLATWRFIDRSRFGMGLKAIREDEDKAEALGVPTTAYKMVAFALSAAFVAVGGALYGIWFGSLDPIFVFSVIIGSGMVLMSLFGGLRFLWGPVLGAFIVAPATEYFLIALGETQVHLLAQGMLLGFVVLVMPDGIIPALRNLWRRRNPPQASIRESAAGTDRVPVPAGAEVTTS